MATLVSQIEEFASDRVRPLPDQPRKRFRGIAELAESIKEVGQSCPGIVTRVLGDPNFDAQLIDGERRLRACRMAGLPFRAEVKSADDGLDATFTASFAANFGKQDHDAMEIAEGLQRLQRSGKTLAQMGRIAGKSGTWAAQHLLLLKLHPDVQAMMIPADDETDESENPRMHLTFSLAQLLAHLPAPRQVLIGKRIIKQGLSIAAARRLIIRERRKLADGEAPSIGIGRSRCMDSIDSMMKSIVNRVGVYLDMPGTDINKLIDTANNKKKLGLVASIEEVLDNLDGLKKLIEERIAKVPVSSATTSNVVIRKARYVGC